MGKEVKQLIEDVELTNKEVSEAITYLLEEHGPVFQIWKQEKKNKEIANYWKNKKKC